MKRKFLSVLLCVGMTSALLAGCGGSGSGSAANDKAAESVASGESGAVSDTSDAASGAADDSSSEADGESGAESTADNADGSDAEDVGASGEDAGTEDGSGAEAELNAYGLTDEQQEALLSSVKAAITEDYLEKYGIAAENFYVNPYDEADMNLYDASGTYTGEDVYQWANTWWAIQQVILNTPVGDSTVAFKLMGCVPVDPTDVYSEAIEEIAWQAWEGSEWVLDAEFDNQLNIAGMSADEAFKATQLWDLQCAVYKGIAEFLNGLDTREFVSVLCHLHWECAMIQLEENGSSATLFDRVLSENLHFE